MTTSAMDEIVSEFLIECRELLDRLDRDLVALEEDGPEPDRIAAVFRAIHTVKGTAGFLGFRKLETLTHAAEDVLGAVRDGRLTLTPELISAQLATLDAVRAMLDAVERSNGADEGDGDYSTVEAELRRQYRGEPVTAAGHEPAAVEGQAAPTPRRRSRRKPAVPTPAEPEVAHSAADESSAAPSPVNGTAASAPILPEAAGASRNGNGAPTPATVTASPDDDRRAAAAGSPLRVDVGLLDRLMNLVGELVLVRNRILQLSGDQPDSGLQNASQRLNLITSELQEGVTRARMQPVRNVWGKLPRMIRDVSRACDKVVALVTEGEDTELDKTILEAIADPLTHLVRNAIDHGIEAPAERLAAGKPESGTITLRAYHEGGIVSIEMADDGAGLDVGRVRAKALEKGLISADQAGRLSDSEAAELIFLPGFSTAAAITNVSGRGVGLDVVRSAIEAIGGTVDVATSSGHGTTFRLKIPLTLAIIPALVVAQGGHRYAIPQVNLLELVRLAGDDVASRIEGMGEAPVYRLRGRLLPLVFLGDVLGTPRTAERKALHIVVLQAGPHRFGLVVDGVNDTAEIVVKPLTSQLKGINAFAGATVMGDGRVALILDVVGLAQRAITGEAVDTAAANDQTGGERDHRPHLVALVGGQRRIGIPLDDIARLEEFAPTNVEFSGHRQVVNYRGAKLSLLDLGSLLGVGSARDSADVLSTVVCGGDRPVGIVVDQILDIHEVGTSAIDADCDHPLLAGSTFVNERIVDLVDTDALLAAAGLPR